MFFPVTGHKRSVRGATCHALHLLLRVLKVQQSSFLHSAEHHPLKYLVCEEIQSTIGILRPPSLAYLLFGDEEYLFIFQEAYKAAVHYLFNDPWYVEVNMNSAALVWPLFNSLQAFWPGLQVLAGDIEPAIRTNVAFFSVWRRYGFTPEGFNLATLSVQQGQKSYPLRPELIESTYWLYKATRDPSLLLKWL